MATTVKKDVSITPVTVNKTRKLVTSMYYDFNLSTIEIIFDEWYLDSGGNQAAIKQASQRISIPQSRAGEPLVTAWLSASNSLILYEL